MSLQFFQCILLKVRKEAPKKYLQKSVKWIQWLKTVVKIDDSFITPKCKNVHISDACFHFHKIVNILYFEN